mmetsp:Transcript_34456/g.45670  ORF Transcript_34456/g.45670 Transcript_34456/m.45670 type:complete len:521 (+) Transcript_34456:41-1603(+)
MFTPSNARSAASAILSASSRRSTSVTNNSRACSTLISRSSKCASTTTAAAPSRSMSSSSGDDKHNTPASFSSDRMKTDARYAATVEVPESLLSKPASEEDEQFNIRGKFREGRAAYLDMSATTPMDPRVMDAMAPHMIGSYGNPHSRTHQYGWDSERASEHARAQVASLIGASPKEIIFTSGATESNNLSIKGAAHFYGKSKKNKRHVITTQTEHKCVLDSCRSLESEGYEVTYLPVEQATGRVNLNDLQNAMRDDTILVSVMAVNNEIGTLQPIAEIGKMCRERKILFHCDAAQMVGKLPIDVNEMNIDLMSISGHKVYGPKGIGGLYVRRRPRVRLEPLFSGGGQERGLRSGTLSHFLCVGFGEACEIAAKEMAYDTEWVTYLSHKLESGIKERIPEVVQNGDPEHRHPGCLNYSFAYVEGESLLMALKNVAISSGSACTSASLEPSYVLRALGVDDELAHSSLRFGIGRFSTEEEVDFVLDLLEHHVGRLREMSPLWEMVQEGIDLKEIQWTQDAHH